MADNEPRMSGPTLKVLHWLLTAGSSEASGAAISKATGVGAGTLYPLLARLEGAGWITGQWERIEPSEAGRPRRRFYELTGLGTTRARAALNEFQLAPTGRGVAWAR